MAVMRKAVEGVGALMGKKALFWGWGGYEAMVGKNCRVSVFPLHSTDFSLYCFRDVAMRRMGRVTKAEALSLGEG